MPFNNPVHISDNDQLRPPQREAWEHVRDHFAEEGREREIGIILPVGCGKSGLLSIVPFAVNSNRVLVIAPGTRIRSQLAADLRSDSPTNFYDRCNVIPEGMDYPEVAVIEPNRVNIDDIRNCSIAVANIQQIAGEENRWLDDLGQDFFDLILVDEAHHNRAASWQQVKARFPEAKIVNFSATPSRTDGTIMEGEIIYAFPVLRAIREGYVKRLRAKMLSPDQLRYVDGENGDRLIGPDEVRQLGQDNAEFRRGIVMSPETLTSIVNQSINELRRLRNETGEQRLKIIASALNYEHCIQITEAFRRHGLRAAYVHSREDAPANNRVFDQLERHEIDVIVQARMLGEGFDHKFLAVAMVGSIFSNLSPFIQFVGRIMRVIEQNNPDSPVNQGVVVFHLGANIASRWNDFRAFSEADQEFFAHLLPEIEDIELRGGEAEREVGGGGGGIQPVQVLEEIGVRAADMAPIGDPAIQQLLERLAGMGITPDQAAEGVRLNRMNRQTFREARRAALHERIQFEAGRILHRLGAPNGGRALDPARRQDNYSWVLSRLNTRVNEEVGGRRADRQAFTLEQLNEAHDFLPQAIAALIAEAGNGEG